MALLAPCAHAAEFAILIHETTQDLALRKDQSPTDKPADKKD